MAGLSLYRARGVANEGRKCAGRRYSLNTYRSASFFLRITQTTRGDCALSLLRALLSPLHITLRGGG